MLVNRESEQMAFSTKVDALLQSKVAAQAEGINPRNGSIVQTATRMVE